MTRELKKVSFESLIGLVINKIDYVIIKSNYKADKHHLEFYTNNGIYTFISEGDCCADIYLEEIVGDIKDLLDTPILQAEKVESTENNSKSLPFDQLNNPDIQIWCFYKLATIKGYVTLRFLENNNGNYSTSLDFFKIIE